MAKKIKQFNRINLKEIRTELEAKLGIIERKFGFEFNAKNISFSSNKFTVKLEGLTIGKGGQTQNETLFIQLAITYGLESTDLGRRFKDRTKIMKIVGLNPNRQKYPISTIDQNGHGYKYSAEQVVRLLKFSPID